MGGGPPSTNSFDWVLLTCRAVNLSHLSQKADANTLLAEAFADELRSRTNYFNAASTKVIGTIAGLDTTNFTITTEVLVKLARPMKL